MIRMYVILLSCCFAFFTNKVCGQTASTYAGGAHGESLARTTSTFQGIVGLYGNIAGIAYVEGFAGDVSYDRRYNLQELSTASLGVAYGSGFGTIGLQASKYGFDSYSETKLGFAYARKLGKGLSLGGMLDLMQYNVEGFGTTNKITFEASLYSELTDKVHLGVHIFSPGTVSLTQIQQVPSRISLGVKYFVSPKAVLIADFTKIAERTLEFKLAADYQLQEQFGIRVGANVSQYSFHAGTYVILSEKIRLTGAYSYSTNLGSTPSLSITYGGFVSRDPLSTRRDD